MPIIVVASIGILVNLGSAWLMRAGHAHVLNKRGAFLHLMADAVVSLTAVLAGVGMLVRPHEVDDDAFSDSTSKALDQCFGINHATLQIEWGDACEHDLHDAAPHHSRN